eukprot:2075221-Rhodomonas_salina.3
MLGRGEDGRTIRLRLEKKEARKKRPERHVREQSRTCSSTPAQKVSYTLDTGMPSEGPIKLQMRDCCQDLISKACGGARKVLADQFCVGANPRWLQTELITLSAKPRGIRRTSSNTDIDT